VILGGLSATVGCHTAGPNAVQMGRSNFNMAVEETNGQQMLLNLVRLRYRDTPFFLQVASISTTVEVKMEGIGTASIPAHGGTPFGLEAKGLYSEKPTITYTPLQGDTFVKQLMTPIDTKTVLLLYHSGWSVSRIFNLLLQNLNGLENAPSATGPTPQHVPQYKEFKAASELLRQLQIKRRLALGFVSSDDKATILELMIGRDDKKSPEAKELFKLLNLNPEHKRFHLLMRIDPTRKDQIYVVPRSMMACLFYVSQCVEVPQADIDAGRVTVTRYPDGRVFDWSEVTGNLMRIRCSKLPPRNAYMKIHYRGTWFYIDDSDLDAKSTFSLLMQLFLLQAGDVKYTAPLLTLPVG
jgi:hypothetical protein